MTTKNLKIFDELNREHYKLKKEEMEKGFADKRKKEAEAQAVEDSGLKRVIVSTNVREPEVEEPKKEAKVAEKPKKKLLKKVEEIKKAEPEPEPEPEVDAEKEALKEELEALKAQLAEKETE
jgi:hypothetical protein